MENETPFVLSTKIPLSPQALNLIEESFALAQKMHNEFLTPEHMVQILLDYIYFQKALQFTGGNLEKLRQNIKEYLDELDKLPEDEEVSPAPSIQFSEVVKIAEGHAMGSGRSHIGDLHLIWAILELEDSEAAYNIYESINGKKGDFLMELSSFYDKDEYGEFNFEEDDIFNVSEKPEDWHNFVVCLNYNLDGRNPLIGRKDELDKTMRVLCRKDKNNPLHIGEPGVGKTALVYGLAQLIEKGEVPEKLKGSKIYRVDMGDLIAGTHYRGDFEKRIKLIMEGLSGLEKPIVYIDEIHNLVGAGATGESSLDASNILKPYLESGKIRFIGSTTYDEYKRYFAKSKGIVRRFSNIDIPEPSIEETVNILQQLKPIYEAFHNVEYSNEAIEFAAKGSAKHINDRFLPDKAIDLIDESGAVRQLEDSDGSTKKVDKELISSVLAKICKVDSLAITEETPEDLENLEKNISSLIFGQERAVREVSEAVLMSKAGLTEESKPMASLLFVGPTGVGKTEVAKVLAQELGIELIRFDMSEYTEKHTVAKLIGSPAGYVGYEDGGLLTDAIRKTPNAVLLLDEIEKAHEDIYNILLQVMDYASLTDNKGNKADFRNVILIMTSNAGAQFASQSNMGFASNVTRGDAMMKQVKKTFKPEFINRLSATVVFNEMNIDMAALILDKKLGQVQKSLDSKNVVIELDKECKDFLINKGFTKEYGAREFDRVIHQYVKKPLMRELLFGKLKNGGKAVFRVEGEELKL